MIRILQGIDIVDVSKFEAVATRSPGLLDELFTDEEKKRCLSARRPYIHFAGRFAAKEACLKALGIGLSSGGIDGALKCVEVVDSGSGKPSLRLSGRPERISRRKKVDRITVSISHTADTAVAMVIMSAVEPN